MIDFASLTKTIRRHPLTSAFDVVLFFTVMVAATLFVVTYDLASFWTHLPLREREITFEETLFLAALGLSGTLVFVWRRVLEERQDRIRRAETLENRALAMIDSLTSLPNRRKFMASLGKAISKSAKRDIAVCLLDLNDFKQINDCHGHQAGDAVLQAVAERFKGATRAGDLLARLGGDEFALIAYNISSSPRATEIADRFVATLVKPVQLDGHTHSVGVSVGVALYPADGATALEILHCADMAMYRAKQSGASAVCFYRDTAGRLTA